MLWAMAVLQPSLSEATLRILDTSVAERVLQQLGSLPAALGQPAANALWGYAQLGLSPGNGR